MLHKENIVHGLLDTGYTYKQEVGYRKMQSTEQKLIKLINSSVFQLCRY
jgi:hypothetical protein